MDVKLFFLAAFLTTAAESQCPSITGWVYAATLNYCFFSQESSTAPTMNYTNAIAYCQSMGGALVSIDNLNVNNAVQNLCSTACLIGLYIPTLTDGLSSFWTDGSTWRFRNWDVAAGAPLTRGHCTTISNDAGGGVYDDVDCATKLPFICKQPAAGAVTTTTSAVFMSTSKYVTSTVTTVATTGSTSFSTTGIATTTTTSSPSSSTMLSTKDATTTTSAGLTSTSTYVPSTVTTVATTGSTSFSTTEIATTTTSSPSSSTMPSTKAAEITTSVSLPTSNDVTSTITTDSTTGDTSSHTEDIATSSSSSSMASSSTGLFTSVAATSLDDTTTTTTLQLMSSTPPLQLTSSLFTAPDAAAVSKLTNTTSLASRSYTEHDLVVPSPALTKRQGTCHETTTKPLATSKGALQRQLVKLPGRLTAVVAMATPMTSRDSVAIPCPPPTAENLGTTTMTVSRDSFGSVATYTCPPGFHFPDGGVRRTSVCTDGVWSEAKSTCRPVTCYVDCAMTSCASGLGVVDFHDTFVSLCDAMSLHENGLASNLWKCATVAGSVGRWNEQPSGCSANRCIPAPYVINATGLLDQSTRSVLVTCFPGHRFPDGRKSQVHSCLSDGSWDTIKSCAVIYCPALYVPSNGTISTTSVVFNTIVAVKCNVGFQQPDGRRDVYILCTDDANWNDTYADCKPVLCNRTSLPSITGASYTALNEESFQFGATILFQCTASGSRMENGAISASATCSDGGIWTLPSSVIKSCEFGRCPPAPNVANAKLDSDLALNNSVVRYTCSDGFKFVANSAQSVVCRNGQQWSSPYPQCEETYCTPIETNDADLNSTKTQYGSVVHVACHVGHLVNGQSNLTVYCNTLGQWTPNTTYCKAVDCGTPSLLPNAYSPTVSTNTTYTANVTYRCNAGYWFERNLFSFTSMCQADGQWNIYRYFNACIPVRCPTLLFKVVSSVDSEVGALVNVTCPRGQRFRSSDAREVQWLLTTCSINGIWIPNVPDCVEYFNQTTTANAHEAKGSTVIGVSAMISVLVLLGLILLLDVVTICKK